MMARIGHTWSPISDFLKNNNNIDTMMGVEPGKVQHGTSKFGNGWRLIP